VPRKLQIKNRYYISFIIDGDTAMRLHKAARLQGISTSELCRRIIIDYLLREFPAEQVQQATPDLGLPDGSTTNAAQKESASERRWRMITKLDEPMVESLIKDSERLEKMMVDLERVPVSLRKTESFVKRRRFAREKLLALKKMARYLLRAGAEIPEEVVDRLVNIEKTLNHLD